jgi:hypothetical protein
MVINKQKIKKIGPGLNKRYRPKPEQEVVQLFTHWCLEYLMNSIVTVEDKKTKNISKGLHKVGKEGFVFVLDAFKLENCAATRRCIR